MGSVVSVSQYYLLLVGLPITAIVFIVLASIKKEAHVVTITAVVTTILAILILLYYRFRFNIQDLLK